MEIVVPNELSHPLFFPIRKIHLEKVNEQDILFFPEFAYYSKWSKNTPWYNPDMEIPLITNKWMELREKLIILFKERYKDIDKYMIEGIYLYITLLFWSNLLPVQLLELLKQIKLLRFKSINVEERFEFILSKYWTYPAFIQLSELITEQLKIHAKNSVMEKYKR